MMAARRFFVGTAVSACLLAAAGLPCSVAQAAPNPPASGYKVDISLKLAKDSFIVGEDMQLQVGVSNLGSAPVQIQNPFHGDNWQPVYTLVGPGAAPGRSFSFRSAVLGDTRPNPDNVIPNLIELAPGGRVQRAVPLHQWAALTEPGRYRLTASLNWKGTQGSSAPVEFTLERVQPSSLSVGVDVGVAGSMGYWVEWLQPAAGAARLYSALYQPPERDVPGFRPFTITPTYTGGAGAGEVLSPWTSYDRMSELIKWRAWREGSSVVGLVTGMGTLARLELPAPPQALIRPALMTRSGELDVFVLASQRELLLVRFTPPGRDGAIAPPRIAWRRTLSYNVVGARAAVLRDAPGTLPRVLALAEDGDDLLVWSLAADGDSVPAAPLRLAGWHTLNRSEPAVRVDSQGVVHAAVLVTQGRRGSPAEPAQLGIVDLVFTADGTPIGAPQHTLLGRLDAQVNAATVEYAIGVIGPNAPMRRDWAVLLADGRVLSPGRPAGRDLKNGPAAVPLELLPTAEGTYLIGLNPKTGPSFNLLP